MFVNYVILASINRIKNVLNLFFGGKIGKHLLD